MRPGPRLGGEGGLGARLEDRAFELLTVLNARNVPAGALEKTDGGPRFPVNIAIIYACWFLKKEKRQDELASFLRRSLGSAEKRLGE